MIHIQLDNRKKIYLRDTKILILKSDGKANNIINNEDEYDVIVVSGGNNRTVNIKLYQPAVIVVENGSNNTVNITGGMALPISQAILIGGQDNKVNGLKNINVGEIIARQCQNFSFELLAMFRSVDVD